MSSEDKKVIKKLKELNYWNSYRHWEQQINKGKMVLSKEDMQQFENNRTAVKNIERKFGKKNLCNNEWQNAFINSVLLSCDEVYSFSLK